AKPMSVTLLAIYCRNVLATAVYYSSLKSVQVISRRGERWLLVMSTCSNTTNMGAGSQLPLKGTWLNINTMHLETTYSTTVMERALCFDLKAGGSQTNDFTLQGLR